MSAVRRAAVIISMGVILSPAALAFELRGPEEATTIAHEGSAWLSVHAAPYDKKRHTETGRAHMHLYNPADDGQLTGIGEGVFAAQPGVFLGWRDTRHGRTPYDTWRLTNCSQRHVKWTERTAAQLRQQIEWSNEDDDVFLQEARTIRTSAPDGSTRVIDVTSVLTAVDGNVLLRGDANHGGLHIRLKGDGEAITPGGAAPSRNGIVTNQLWAGVQMGEASILVMAHPSMGDDIQYAVHPESRLSVSFERDIPGGKSITIAVRIVIATGEMTNERAEALRQDFRTE